MKISILHLQALQAVGFAGTFELAAKNLHVTQSTITKRIQDLENASGQKLFDRSQRQNVLTEIGEEVYIKAQNILKEVDSLYTIKTKDQQSFRIKAGFTELSSLTWLPNYLEEINHNPKFDFDITIGLSKNLTHMIEEEELDIALVPETNFQSDIISIPATSLEVALICGYGKFDSSKIYQLSDLQSEILITQGQHSIFSNKISKWLLQNGRQTKGRVKVDSQHASLGLVVAGVGICFYGKKHLKPLVDAKKIDIINVTPKLPPVTYCLIYKNSVRNQLLENLSQEICKAIDFSKPFYV